MFSWTSLTPEEPVYTSKGEVQDVSYCTWLEDSYCQENLFQIISLMPEETVVDDTNHIHCYVKLFFEELGYLTEEPEPIDPSRDYEAEAKQLLHERNQKNRRNHVELSSIASLQCLTLSSSV